MSEETARKISYTPIRVFDAPVESVVVEVPFTQGTMMKEIAVVPSLEPNELTSPANVPPSSSMLRRAVETILFLIALAALCFLLQWIAGGRYN